MRKAFKKKPLNSTSKDSFPPNIKLDNENDRTSDYVENVHPFYVKHFMTFKGDKIARMVHGHEEEINWDDIDMFYQKHFVSRIWNK